MRRALTLLFIVTLSLCACGTPTGPATPIRVLFIGNSYTIVNDLPGTFAALAKSGGHPVETGLAAQGGWTLAQHAGSSQTLEMLYGSKWDYVVLQEQSQIPSVESVRSQVMYPAARSLVEAIRKDGATPIFYLTWAHRDGWPEQGLADYESMQLQIDQGYMTIAHETHSPVAPVGYAWLTAWYQNPQVALWQGDNSHPTVEGTYLAACVFYAALFKASPQGLAYRDGLTAQVAAHDQELAAQTVLQNAGSWSNP